MNLKFHERALDMNQPFDSPRVRFEYDDIDVAKDDGADFYWAAYPSTWNMNSVEELREKAESRPISISVRRLPEDSENIRDSEELYVEKLQPSVSIDWNGADEVVKDITEEVTEGQNSEFYFKGFNYGGRSGIAETPEESLDEINGSSFSILAELGEVEYPYETAHVGFLDNGSTLGYELPDARYFGQDPGAYDSSEHEAIQEAIAVVGDIDDKTIAQLRENSDEVSEIDYHSNPLDSP